MSEKAINGQEYSWADIRLNFLSRSPSGIKGIDYEDGQDTKPVYGRGVRPVGLVSGNYQATAQLILLMSEVEALNQSLKPGTTIYDIPPFDIVVAFVNPEKILITHVLKGCKFLKQNRSAKSGEVKEMEVTLPLYVTEIDWAA